MFPTIVLVAFFATVTNAKGACYVPNGIDRHSLSNIGDNENDNIGNNNLGILNIGNHGTNSDSLCVLICRG
ncbi:hypothetical protein CGCVW01_v006613 [Colletotrichum viniferum]|nr:hypothetical protein CGCVW01_v006613 [Colletotrichum viniferum]